MPLAIIDIGVFTRILEDPHKHTWDHLAEAEGRLALALRDTPQERFLNGEMEEGIRDPVLQ
jgi:hypothetical protein